jgi:twitching motility protein PilT
MRGAGGRRRRRTVDLPHEHDETGEPPHRTGAMPPSPTRRPGRPYASLPMKEQIRDPDLDRLVAELNRGVRAEGAEGAEGEETRAAAALAAELAPPVLEPEGGSLDRAAQARVEEGGVLDRLLSEMVRRGASDLLLLAGLPPVFRVDGRLARLDPLGTGGFDGDELGRLFQPHLGVRGRRELDERGAADFSLRLAPGRELDAGATVAWRFRVNLHRQRGQLAAAVRALPRDIPGLASLHLPPGLADLVVPARGLVLVCGPTGAGKSSTLAALVAEINRTRSAHVITIEDPVEFEHRPLRSVVEHVEIGRDARSFPEALRAALRQDPDVILVGEMRDLETVATALTAAETGHLILSTLHTNDAVQAVHRMVDVFPPGQQAQIRQQLALSLHAILAQQLVPRADGRGRLPAVELMLATYAVRNHIRSDHLHKLYNEITLGKRQGMLTFEESLGNLVRDGFVDLEEARVRASHPEEFESRMRGFRPAGAGE